MIYRLVLSVLGPNSVGSLALLFYLWPAKAPTLKRAKVQNLSRRYVSRCGSGATEVVQWIRLLGASTSPFSNVALSDSAGA